MSNTVASVQRPGSARVGLRQPQSPVLGGRLHHEKTGHPLSGLIVTAELTTATGERHAVGSGVTDHTGSFSVVPARGDDEALHLIGRRGAALVLTVADSSGVELLRSGDVSGSVGARSVILSVPLRQLEPTREDWAQLAARLIERRHSRLHETIRHLVLAPTKESVVGDWPLELRHAMAGQLEQAFLDPAGVLTARHAPPSFFEVHARNGWEAYRRVVESPPDPAVTAALDRAVGLYKSYSGVFSADWEMDLQELGDGNSGQATTNFEQLYAEPGEASQAPPPFAKNPKVPYRDYLRTLFTGGSPSDPESQTKLEQLTTRFHQNFKTVDESPRSANAIMVSILKTILTAPPGNGYGFGLGAAQIEPQGGRTHREYLDYLIGLSKLQGGELAKRYRLDLSRPDSAESTFVEENVSTLQGFYRDGFQSGQDQPSPIFDDALLGKAPFFLYYDEWLRRTGPFYPENLYRLTDTFRFGARPDARKKAVASAEGDPEEVWFGMTVQVEDLIAEGHALVRDGQHRLAIQRYVNAWSLGHEALEQSVDAYAGKTGAAASDVWLYEMPSMLEQVGAELRGHTIASELDLVQFVDWVRWAGGYSNDLSMSGFSQWMDNNIAYRWLGLIRACAFILPACIAEATLVTGDYASAAYFFSLATRHPVGRGPADIVSPYRTASFALYQDGALPYTIDVSADSGDDWVPYAYPGIPGSEHFQQQGSYHAARYHDVVLHEMEQRWAALRQADALVQWADSLYRTDEAGSIERARELYKAALFTMQAPVGISPSWDSIVFFENGTVNPARTVLKGQAHKGILQIEAGLNYYGADDSLVPHLRYRTLKEAADRFGAAAKSAETDLLAYLSNIEDALVEQMVHANMLAKAELQAGIASEQAQIAQFEVGLAQRQVEAVQAEIAKKEQELEDESGLFEQFKDVVVGMKDTIVDMPGGLTGFALSGAQASGTSAGAGLAGTSAMAAGAGVMSGYAIFLYAGITSLSSVQDNLTSIEGQVKALKNTALPLAEAQVGARERQVHIADLQLKIAEADAHLARDLIQFAELRFLNVDFWAELSALTRRTLRRYLTLGGRFAWLTERALAYEQDRALDIVRLDYVPLKHQGITGAGQLLADLSELEVSRLDGLRQALAVRRTWSLAFDFPLQFAQLKATGHCEFHTTDAAMRVAHPGTYAHRIETVRVYMQDPQGVDPFRGLLRNTGLSMLTRSEGDTHLSLRFEEAMPLSEPGSDGWVVTPAAGETLGLFEGIGVETTWRLELPAAANPYGLDDLADVLFAIEARAHFAEDLYDSQQANPAANVQKYIALSAAKHSPEALDAMHDPGIDLVTLDFDLASIGLPVAETNRTVTNAFVMLAGPGDGDGQVKLGAASQGNPVTVSLVEGIALSNAGALANGQSVQPLNALVGLSATQTFTLSLSKAELNGTDFAELRDVVLGIEYTADLEA